MIVTNETRETVTSHHTSCPHEQCQKQSEEIDAKLLAASRHLAAEPPPPTPGLRHRARRRPEDARRLHRHDHPHGLLQTRQVHPLPARRTRAETRQVPERAVDQTGSPGLGPSRKLPASRAVRARLLLQSMADSPFTLEPRYLLYPWALAHSLAELEEREDAAWELLALLAPVRQRHHNWFLQGYIDSEGVEHPYNHRFVEFRIAWCLFWRGESYRKFQERLVSQRRHRR